MVMGLGIGVIRTTFADTAFTAASISDLDLWYDFSTLSGSDGDDVTGFANAGGAGSNYDLVDDEGTTANRPQINDTELSLRSLHFGSGGDRMNLDNTYITTDKTFSFFVVYHGDSTDADTFFAGESAGANTIGFTNQKNVKTRFNGSASGTLNPAQNCRPDNTEVSGGSAIDGGDGDVSYTFTTDPEILILTRAADGGTTGDGGLIRYFNKNGALICTSTNPVAQADTNFQVKELGALSTGGSDYEGVVGEMGIYNKTLTDAEVIQLASHLKSKWSIS
jgi:hypothetical protein